MKGKKLFRWFLGFRCFLTLFKFGAWLHYALESSLWEKVLPLWIVGICISIASVWQMIFDIPAGRFLDKHGYKKVLIRGACIFVLTVSLFLRKFTQGIFLLSVLGSIFGRLFFGPGMNAYALSHAPKGLSGKFMWYRDVAASLGIVLSCLLLPFVIHLAPFRLGIIIGSILLTAIIAMLFSPKDIRKVPVEEWVHHKTHHQRRLALGSLLAGIKQLNPASSLLMLHNFCGAVLYGIIRFVVPLIIEHFPAKWTLLGIWLSMFDFSILIIWSILCTFVDKINKKLIIFIGLLIFSISWFLLGFDFWIVFLILAFLTTTGDEMASLPLRSWMHQLDAQHDKDGLISWTINLFEDLWWAIGPLVAGIAYSLLWPTYTIMIGAVPLVVLTLLYYAVVHKHIIHFSFLEWEKKPHKMRHKN